MCGIAGLMRIHGSGHDADPAATALRMVNAVSHRGPDGEGRWGDADAGIGLGHRRLAIVDLSPSGAQPMTSADGRYVIIFNGEVYNFDELAADLDDGATLRAMVPTVAATVIAQTIAAKTTTPRTGLPSENNSAATAPTIEPHTQPMTRPSWTAGLCSGGTSGPHERTIASAESRNLPISMPAAAAAARAATS